MAGDARSFAEIPDSRYSAQELLGTGGTADVYRARDTSLSRDVAIKVFRTAHAALPEVAKQFAREMKTMSRLDHPAIAKIYASATMPQGQPYIVMEYIDGQTLFDLIAQQEALQPAQALEICRQVAAAIEYMHNAGVIHRDLKPSNIMCRRKADGAIEAKIIDVGYSKMLQQQAFTMTAPGTVVGTPAYMSPEQCMGLAADRRSDVFALGLMLYEMLT